MSEINPLEDGPKTFLGPVNFLGQAFIRGVPLGGGATISVASNDATAREKAKAAYICDGVDDDVQIQAALDALPTLGGIVELSAGEFELSNSLTFPSKSLIFRGAGTMGHLYNVVATILKFTFSSTDDCIVPSNDTDPQRFENFAIYGDNTNTRDGISVGASAGFKAFHNITINNITTYGVDLDNGNSQNIFYRVLCRDAPTGFHSYGSNNEYYHCEATRSSAGAAANFEIHETGSFYYGCVSDKNQYGFYFSTYATGSSIHGCYSEDDGIAFEVNGTSPNEPKGCSVYGAYIQGATTGGNAAVRVNRCDGLLLSGLCIKDTVNNMAISFNTTSANVTVIGGQTNDTTPITDAGATNVRIYNFSGYVNEAQGAAGSTGDGGTIAHGLSGTPTVAVVSPSVASEMASVTGLDGTNITVAIKDDTGAAGTSQTIYWRAWI